MVLKPHQIGQTRYVYYTEDKQFVTYEKEIAISKAGNITTQAAALQEEEEMKKLDNELQAQEGFQTARLQKKPPVIMIKKSVTSLDFPIFLLDLALIGYNATLPILALGIDYFAHTLYKPISPISKNAEFQPELTKADIAYLEEKRKAEAQNKKTSNRNTTDDKTKMTQPSQEQIMF